MTDAKREAPSPSSLAGGEVREVMISLGWSVVESRGYGLICWGWSAPCEDGGESHKRRDWTEEQAWADAEQVFNRRVERARVILAALSPEAPAREGVALDKRIADAAERDRRERDKAFRGESYEPLTPTHEAPAEGAGEAPRAAINSLTRSVENFDNGYEWGCDPVAVRAILRHLRARSSAPEALEETLGNLLAVIHGDGGHRALEVGTKQAALEAEKIVARLLSSAPEAREGEAVAGAALAKAMWGIDLVPAAPSADKLRELVGASEDILSALSKLSVAGKPIASLDTKLREAINTLVPVLAALKAETDK